MTINQVKLMNEQKLVISNTNNSTETMQVVDLANSKIVTLKLKPAERDNRTTKVVTLKLKPSNRINHFSGLPALIKGKIFNYVADQQSDLLTLDKQTKKDFLETREYSQHFQLHPLLQNLKKTLKNLSLSRPEKQVLLDKAFDHLENYQQETADLKAASVIDLKTAYYNTLAQIMIGLNFLDGDTLEGLIEQMSCFPEHADVMAWMTAALVAFDSTTDESVNLARALFSLFNEACSRNRFEDAVSLIPLLPQGTLRESIQQILLQTIPANNPEEMLKQILSSMMHTFKYDGLERVLERTLDYLFDWSHIPFSQVADLFSEQLASLKNRPDYFLVARAVYLKIIMKAIEIGKNSQQIFRNSKLEVFMYNLANVTIEKLLEIATTTGSAQREIETIEDFAMILMAHAKWTDTICHRKAEVLLKRLDELKKASN